MATLTKELTSGRPLPLILNFTLPLLMGNLLQQTYSLVDAVIVAAKVLQGLTRKCHGER